jgi:hypothetical protein
VSRYDWFRRRIAPIALFVALALMARESCQKTQRTHATIVIELGSAASRVRALDAEVWMNGERVAVAHREPLGGGALGPVRLDVSLPGDDGELRIDVDLGTTERHLVRRFHAEDDSTVSVRIADDLRAP